MGTFYFSRENGDILLFSPEWENVGRMGTFYFSRLSVRSQAGAGAQRSRPRGRSAASSPNTAAVRTVHVGEPKGAPIATRSSNVFARHTRVLSRVACPIPSGLLFTVASTSDRSLAPGAAGA